MKREIKFRAWDGKKMYAPFDMPKYLQTNWMPWEPFMPDNIFLQFTGLKDKNGKEIYEGDIIETPEGNIIEIFWGQRTYRFGMDQVECNGWIARNKRGHTESLDSSMVEGEVIGNIYENPELINPF